VSFNVDPVNAPAAWGQEVLNMANLFSEFRCVSVQIQMFPAKSDTSSTGNSDTGYAIGWKPMVPAVAPSTIDDVMASAVSAYTTDHVNQPLIFRITGRSLRKHNMLKWYHADASSPITDLAMQGRIYHVATGTNASTAVWTWIICSTWEFRGLVPFGEYLQKFEKQIKKIGKFSPPPELKEDVKLYLEELSDEKSDDDEVVVTSNPAACEAALSTLTQRLKSRAMSAPPGNRFVKPKHEDPAA
jgi:hypothetical protein